MTAPQEAIRKLPRQIQQQLEEYFATEWRVAAPVNPSDVVLALLRLGLREHAEQVMGKPIQVCQAYVPPWSPTPVAKLRALRITGKVAPNPCQPKSDAHKRFATVRVGMTLAQLEGRGISKRDIRIWRDRKWIEVGT